MIVKKIGSLAILFWVCNSCLAMESNVEQRRFAMQLFGSFVNEAYNDSINMHQIMYSEKLLTFLSLLDQTNTDAQPKDSDTVKLILDPSTAAIAVASCADLLPLHKVHSESFLCSKSLTTQTQNHE